MTSAIDRFLASIEAADIPGSDVFAADAVLDATVPHWRFTVAGRDGVVETFAEWYADPGHFESVARCAIDGGEVVEFVLHWTEQGIPHSCHQLHRLELDADGRISRDTAFCGGRWPLELMEEMAAAQLSNAG